MRETQGSRTEDTLGFCLIGAGFIGPVHARNIAAHPRARLRSVVDLDTAAAHGLADPLGASLYHYYRHGELKAEGSSITEGIGQSRITKNLEGAPVDEAFQIPDAEALTQVFDLLRHEGLNLGTSSGINVAGAIRLARQMGPGHTLVTVLCDGGARYASRLFNPEFLRSKNLPVPEWLEGGNTVPVPTPLLPS